jgi:DNA-binding MarR family transcriptional regulator
LLRLVAPIHRTTHRIGLYLATIGDRSLSQGEAHILAMLAPAGTATMADLHKALAHKRSTLTSIVDRLVARRFVTRHVGESDRRTFVVTLTAQGRKVARQILQQLTDLERAVTAHVSSDDLRGFLTVIAAVEKEAHERGSPRSRPPSTTAATTARRGR